MSRRRPLTGDLGDACARILLGGLFLGLAVRIGQNFLLTGKLTGLLLLVSELLVVVLTCFRRRAMWVDRGLWTRAIATASILGPMCLQPTGLAGMAPEVVTATASALGLAVIVAGKPDVAKVEAEEKLLKGIVSDTIQTLALTLVRLK